VIDRRRAEEARADQVFDQHRATYEPPSPNTALTSATS